MSKNSHPITPTAIIQSKPPGLPASAAKRLTSGNFDSTPSKLNEIYKNNDIEIIRHDLEDYYRRGINLLRPEIIMSSEYVPIRKDFNDSPGLQIQTGEKRISVNQVFKLIELHHSVQKSVNIASIEFLESASGVPVKEFYKEACNHFEYDMLKPNIHDSIFTFQEKLISNLAPIVYTDSELVRTDSPLESFKEPWKGNNFSPVGSGPNNSGGGSGGGSNQNNNEQEDENDEGRGVVPTNQVVHFTFRNLILNGSDIQKETIKRVIEIIILEKITGYLFNFFQKIVYLKEVRIPKYHDLSRMQSASSSMPHQNLGTVATKNFRLLKKNYKDLHDSSSHETSISYTNDPDAMQSSSGGVLSGPFKYTGIHNLAKFGLCVGSVESDNFTTIYAIFQSILKSLTFNLPGDVTTDHIEAINGVLAKRIFNDFTGLGKKNKEKITDFFKNVGVSSFPNGNAKRRHMVEDAVFDNNKKYRSRIYTSSTLNQRTREISGDYPITHSTSLREISDISAQDSVDSYRSEGDLTFLKPMAQQGVTSAGMHLGLQQSCELLSACIFDLFYSLNVRKYTQDSFGNSTLSSGGLTGMERYAKTLLGPNALDVINSENSSENNIDMVDKISYESEDNDNIDHDLGILGNVLFNQKTILSNKVSCLPGSNRAYEPLNRTLPGTNSIPLEAFGDNSFASLNSYISNLENIVNRTFSDVGKMFGIFEVPGYGQVTETDTPLDLFNAILIELANEIQPLIDNISHMQSNQWTSSDYRRALSVLFAIGAGQNDGLLCQLFIAHYLREDGYFDDSQKWVKAIRGDAASGALFKLFDNELGKRPQHVTEYTADSYLESEDDAFFWGQYPNYWIQRKDVSEAADYTWMKNSNFDNTKVFLGRPIPSETEGDLEKEDTMTFFCKNTKSELFEKSENLLRQSEGSALNNACDYIRNFFQRKDKTLYKSVMQQINTGISTEFSEQIEVDGRIGVDAKYEYYDVLKTQAERPGKLSSNYSLFESTDLHREFAIFSFLCKLLNRCLSVRVRFKSEGSGSSNKKLMIDFSKTQLMAFVDAIKNKNYTQDMVASWRPSRFESAKLEVLKQKSFINHAKKPLWNRINRVKICYATLYAHLNNLHFLKEQIARQVHPSSLSTGELLAINYYGLSEESSNSNSDRGQEPIIEDNQIGGLAMKKSLLFQLSSTSLPGYYKNFLDHMQKSKGNIAYSSCENITDRQIYQMQLAFSGENFGHAGSEKLGKKTILNIGIPPGQLSQLAMKAQRAHGNLDYLMSPYICLHVFKKDALGGDILYYPKPFIFNSSLIAFENCDHSGTLEEFNFEDPDHETDFLSINSFESLMENFSLYKYDTRAIEGPRLKKLGPGYEPKDLLVSSNDLNYISSGGAGTRGKEATLEEMKINHVMDYYLKMYMKMTTGLDVTETIFPVFDYNKIKGEVDSTAKPLFDLYRKELFLRYPSVNVDPVLAREFIRLEKNIASSRFFSLNEKVKNVFASKCFERIYSVMINEADFVVYPYPDIIVAATEGQANLGNVFNNIVQNQAFINSLPSLYDPCPYFNLNSGRQIYGINSLSKAKLTSDLVQTKSQFSNLSTDNFKSLDRLLSGKYRQLLKHMNEVEFENVSDVYEFFVVASVIRRK